MCRGGRRVWVEMFEDEDADHGSCDGGNSCKRWLCSVNLATSRGLAPAVLGDDELVVKDLLIKPVSFEHTVHICLIVATLLTIHILRNRQKIRL